MRIPDFYRKSTIHKLMYAHVNVLLRQKGMTVSNAVEDFMETYKISFMDYDLDSAITTYHRMKDLYSELISELNI